MSIKTIKDVDEGTWRKLKLLSSEEDVRMGILIGKITDTYIKSKDKIWKSVLNSKKILSDSEAREMEKVVNDMRKESGFR